MLVDGKVAGLPYFVPKPEDEKAKAAMKRAAEKEKADMKRAFEDAGRAFEDAMDAYKL